MTPFSDLSISKDKLPKGSSYVLQTTDVVDALDAALLRQIYYTRRLRNDGIRAKGTIDILYCYYSPTDERPFLLTIYSVPSEHRSQLREAVKQEVLPVLREWMAVQKNQRNMFHVHYERPHPDTYELHDSGGIYMEQDGNKRGRFGRREKRLIRRIKEFVLSVTLASAQPRQVSHVIHPSRDGEARES